MTEHAPPSASPSAIPSTADILDLLCAQGERLAPGVRAELLESGRAIVPSLIDILARVELIEELSSEAGRVPCHAVELLGALRATEAIEPMLDLLEIAGPLEPAHSGIVDAVTGFEMDALDPVLARLGALNPLGEEDIHDGLCEVLAGLGVCDDRIPDVLVARLSASPELIGTLLVRYGQGALGPLQESLDAFEPEQGCAHCRDVVEAMVDAIAALGGTLSPTQEHKARRNRRVDRLEAYLLGRRQELDAAGAGNVEALRGPRSKRDRPGRNEPCWCRSGRKYKKCHLREDEREPPRERAGRAKRLAADVELVVLRAARAHLGDSWRAEERFLELGADPAWEDELQLFIPWAAHHYQTGDEPASTWFQRTEGLLLTPPQRDLLLAQRTAWLGIWEVTDVDRGTAIGLRDALRGAERRVAEPEASFGVQPGDLVLARVVDHDDVSFFDGVHPLALPERAGREVVEAVRAAADLPAGPATPEQLRSPDSVEAMLRCWCAAVDAMTAAAEQAAPVG